MKKIQIIAVAVLLSALAAALPLTAMFLFGRQRALRSQEQHLTGFAAIATKRANTTYNDAVTALKEVDAISWKDCSPEHVLAMRQATFRHPYIAEMGYIPNELLKCTSWGPVRGFIPHPPPTFVRSDGVRVKLHVWPHVVRGREMMALTFGQHNVLVDPNWMVDVLVDNEVELAIASEQGEIISTLNGPSQEIVRYAIAHPGGGVYGSVLYSSYRSNGWIAVAIEQRKYLSEEFQHELAVLLPVGLLMAAIIVTGIVVGMRRRLAPRAELEIAVRKKEFIAFYQPIMELATGRCVGAEALVRWLRPDGNVASPGVFLPLAEQTGLIRPITDQVIGRVVEDLGEALRANPSMHVTVNLSSEDMETGRPLPLLADLLEKNRIPTSSIWIEATERGFINPKAARETLMRARSQGHMVAIDDFGTAYSSLSLLHSLPLDALKIDQTFVEAIGTESATSMVIGHIIDMAASLQLTMIAEGIETEEQVRYLRDRNVEFGQGFLFARPMPAHDFLEFYRQHAGLNEG